MLNQSLEKIEKVPSFASSGNKLCSKICENDKLNYGKTTQYLDLEFKRLLEEDVLPFISKLPSETNVDILGYDSWFLKQAVKIICSSL